MAGKIRKIFFSLLLCVIIGVGVIGVGCNVKIDSSSIDSSNSSSVKQDDSSSIKSDDSSSVKTDDSSSTKLDDLVYGDFKILKTDLHLGTAEATASDSGDGGFLLTVGVKKEAYETHSKLLGECLYVIAAPKNDSESQLSKDNASYSETVSGKWSESSAFDGYMQSVVYIDSVSASEFNLYFTARAYWDNGENVVYSDEIEVKSLEVLADEAINGGEYTQEEQIKTLESYLTEYAVTFENCDGIVSQKVKYGKTAVEPENDPEKDESDFVGWFGDAECNTVYDFSKRITENVKVYAKWKDWSEVNGSIKSKTYTYSDKDYALYDIDYSKVTLTLTDSEGAATVASVDENGNYSAKVRDGEYVIKATYPNYYDVTKTVVVEDGENSFDLIISQRKVNGSVNIDGENIGAAVKWTVNGDGSVASMSNSFTFFDGLLVDKNANFVVSTELYYVATTSGTPYAGFLFLASNTLNSGFGISVSGNKVFMGKQGVLSDLYAPTTAFTAYTATTSENRLTLTVVKNNGQYYAFVNGNIVCIGMNDSFLTADTGITISLHAYLSSAVFDNYFYTENAELNNALIAGVSATEKTIDGDLSDWSEDNWTGEQAIAVRSNQLTATNTNGDEFKAMAYLGTDGVYLAAQIQHSGEYKNYAGTNNQWWSYSYVAFFLNSTSGATMKNTTTVNADPHQHRLFNGYTKGNVIAKFVTAEVDGKYVTTIEAFVPWAVCDNYADYLNGDTLRMGFDCNMGTGVLRFENKGPDVLAQQYYLTANGLTK